jgi:uncharacterized protein (TIGR00252 family)
MNKRAKGKSFEEAAAKYLEQKGYRVLERNYHIRGGEIDLIASSSSILVFAEVKMRSSEKFGRPEEAVGRVKQQRIVKAAADYLTRNRLSNKDIRFDVIAVTPARDGFEFNHLEDAFRAEEEQVYSGGTGASEENNLMLDRCSIFYRRWGEGTDACLFLHGIPTNGLLWRKVAPAVAKKGYLCLAPDQIGLGKSSAPEDEDFSLEGQAELIHRMLERLNLRRIHMVGHDTGGGIAQIFASRWPERLKSLVLTNPVAFTAWPVPIVRWMQRCVRWGLGGWLMKPGWAKAAARSRWGFPSLLEKPEGYDPMLIDLYLEPLLRSESKREQFRRYLLAMDNRQTTRLKLNKVECPVLIAWAKGDRYLSETVGRKLAGEFTNAEFKLLQRGGHLHPEECPDQLTETLLQFWQKME